MTTNFIDHIETRRESEGLTIERLCKDANISPTSYHRYKNPHDTMDPSLKVASRMMEAVGLKLVSLDQEIDNLKKNHEWGIMAMYFDAHKTECADIFRKLTKSYIMSDGLINAALKLSLLSVWYFKVQKKTAKKRFFGDVIFSTYHINDVVEKCKELGLFNTSDSPSERAIEYHNMVFKSMKEYLSESNIVYRVY